MNSKELNIKLIKCFPVLEERFNSETSWQEGLDTGSVVVFEDVFMPYIIYCVENNIAEEINKIYQFIEDCIISNDEYQKNVITIAILDNFKSYDIEEKLSQYLLPESMLVYKTI